MRLGFKRYDYDLAVIGLGPAGMAVSLMASQMGLKVCAIEKDRIGGECMNVGCIPSKALIRFAKHVHQSRQFAQELHIPSPFSQIQQSIDEISENKLLKLFDRVDLILKKGAAQFEDAHTLSVGDLKITAKRIFICTGSKPDIPKIEGLDRVSYLTNENVFHLDKIPKSLLILGGGAIGCEMAQAFCRLGTQVHLVNEGETLLPKADREAAVLLQDQFLKEGVQLYHSSYVTAFKQNASSIECIVNGQKKISIEQVLLATGRTFNFSKLGLDRAGVCFKENKIGVNAYLQTNISHIYAIGDVNREAMFSHAAMHQGMLSLMNILLPWPFKKSFRQYVVPWSIFTEPAISHVGSTEKELQALKKEYRVFSVRYEDYGAAIAEKLGSGFVKALIAPSGQILGVSIIGEGSADLINEWALAIQEKIPIYKICLLQHSFPSMSYLNKQLSEKWMMAQIRSPWAQKLLRWFL